MFCLLGKHRPTLVAAPCNRRPEPFPMHPRISHHAPLSRGHQHVVTWSLTVTRILPLPRDHPLNATASHTSAQTPQQAWGSFHSFLTWVLEPNFGIVKLVAF